MSMDLWFNQRDKRLHDEILASSEAPEILIYLFYYTMKKKKWFKWKWLLPVSLLFDHNILNCYWNGDLPLPFPSRFLFFSLPIRTNEVVEEDRRENPKRRIQFQSTAV
ncbi:hypothetical protein MKW98_024715 [Papaver atlanticum]|uniref:Uncharacterized protein n=1 Tax=Papaver atlanticum TaxID=357466 RepID=A0AAD4S244_9MAGN|nr:hypothetical protein MKW98_024715 [Papaver atlanticum]